MKQEITAAIGEQIPDRVVLVSEYVRYRFVAPRSTPWMVPSGTMMMAPSTGLHSSDRRLPSSFVQLAEEYA